MTNFIKILLVFWVLFIEVLSLNAQEIYLSQQTTKDYSFFVKLGDELKLGNNEFNIKIIHKTKPLSNANVNLKLYKPDGVVANYNNKVANDKNNYLFNIKLKEKGLYKYVVSYTVMSGGVTHYFRGFFKL